MTAHTLYVVNSPAVKPPQPPCPVCGSSEGLRDSWSCDGCGVEIHAECYWGRVATLAEWQDYLARWIAP